MRIRQEARELQSLVDTFYALPPIPSESITLCGPAVLSLMTPTEITIERLNDVLHLAHTQLQVFPYADVPLQWRRLYTDAAILKALLANDTECLDMAVILAGAAGRRAFIETIMPVMEVGEPEKALQWPVGLREETSWPDLRFPIRLVDRMGLMEFSRLTQPVIITGSLEHWPAMERWRPGYLLRHGHRLVPVETGRSYTDDGWGQRIMSFREFVRSHILCSTPLANGEGEGEGAEENSQTVYLAQHNLFAQIPSLREDICIPDYCYVSRSDTDDEEETTMDPLLHAWFGPASTISPLHTDPYENLLCQVVGRKYVRLYGPSETGKLYARGVEEGGVDMGNTSRVDVEGDVELTKREFPMFGQARYVEGVLGEGECLYIPTGWWHYVRSLSVSFSSCPQAHQPFPTNPTSLRLISSPSPPLIMLTHQTKGFNPYAIKYSPFYDSRLAVASSANFGLVGNGRLSILSLTPQGIVADRHYDTADALFDLTFSEAHANQLLVACGDGSVKLFDVGLSEEAGGFPVAVWKEHIREVFCVHWNLVGKETFCSGSWDGGVKIYNPHRSASLLTLPTHSCTYSALWSPHSPSLLSSASSDSHLRIFDLRTPPSAANHLTLSIPIHGSPSPSTISKTPLSPSSSSSPPSEALTHDWNKYRPETVAVAGVDRLIRVFDLRNPSAGPVTVMAGHDYAIRKIAWSPHLSDLLLSASYDMTCRLWTDGSSSSSSPSLSSISSQSFPVDGGSGGARLLGVFPHHTEFVTGVDWCLFGTEGWAASCGWDERVFVWDVRGVMR
ncbi:MAG: peroxisomal targeting signal 2 receptor [Caeruleum heppii]|nr:MAG: peroxisomal targeting signal 2 receptor [Caeruleum heppii]